MSQKGKKKRRKRGLRLELCLGISFLGNRRRKRSPQRRPGRHSPEGAFG